MGGGSKMIIDEKCVMREIGIGEDMEHLLVTCGKFEREQCGMVMS